MKLKRAADLEVGEIVLYKDVACEIEAKFQWDVQVLGLSYSNEYDIVRVDLNSKWVVLTPDEASRYTEADRIGSTTPKESNDVPKREALRVSFLDDLKPPEQE